MAVIEAAVRQDFHLDSQQGFELVRELDEVEQGCAGLEAHQQVDIALRCVLPAGDRPEYANVAGTVGMGQIKDFIPMLGKKGRWARLRCAQDAGEHLM